MEVNLSPDLEAKLARIANQRGCDAEAVARDAIERVVNYDEWFIGEVEKGLAQIDRGEVLTHEAVGSRVEKRLTEKHPRP
jgi:predicted transcriptional regulator